MTTDDSGAGSDSVGGDAETNPQPGFDQQKLRHEAMELLRKGRSNISTMATEDLASLVGELELHQAELAVQNEELRRIQVELTAIRDRYRDLYEFAPVGYLTLDTKGKILQANLAATRLSGIERDSLIGKGIDRLITSDRGACYALLNSSLGHDEHQSRELRLHSLDGHELWVKAEVSSLEGTADRPPGFLMTLTDISGRKRAEEALRQLNEQLESRITERTKKLEQLVRTLQGEVEHREAAEKAFKGANDQLARRAAQLRALAGELTLAEQRERRRLARVLHDHLQQVLVATKFRVSILGRAAGDEVREGTTEIEKLLNECIAASRSLTADLSPPILHEIGLLPGLDWLSRWMAERHGLTVNLVFEEGLPPLTDDVKVLLFESVRELLFNAVKHARVRTAEVDVRRIEGNRLQVTVTDSGPGFEPDNIKAAGEPGGGFGLFGIRERIDVFGGTMEIDSRPGIGSRFLLKMPLRETVSAPQPLAAPGAVAHQSHPSHPILGAPIRVLLADDHITMRQGLARLLGEEPDIQIVGEAADGREAVEMAGALLPDVILMDISMPGLNGVQATQLIHREYHDIHIIGLSMFEEGERAQEMLAAGADAYLSKSGPSSKLLAAVRDCASRRPKKVRPSRKRHGA